MGEGERGLAATSVSQSDTAGGSKTRPRLITGDWTLTMLRLLYED